VGGPHAAWFPNSPPSARQASARPSVVSDSQDKIHLCWRSGGFLGQGILSYGRLEGGRWHEEIVDAELGSTGYCSIAVERERQSSHRLYPRSWPTGRCATRTGTERPGSSRT
jgi:hypothetical protein